MHKAVFLDRDGTINIDKGYIWKEEDFIFIPGAIEGMKLLKAANYLLIVVSNQSGIARGFYTEDDYLTLNSWMIECLKKKGVDIDASYYCPHFPDAPNRKYGIVCDCRKPKLGMYKRAIKDLDIDLDQSWAVGDKIRDCALCESGKCKGILIGENENSEIIEKVKKNYIKKVSYAFDLFEASKIIINSNR